jgi:hypothetical protein
VLQDGLQRQRSLSNSAEGREPREEKRPAQSIRKERARKLKGRHDGSQQVYHFCPQCM